MSEHSWHLNTFTSSAALPSPCIPNVLMAAGFFSCSLPSVIMRTSQRCLIRSVEFCSCRIAPSTLNLKIPILHPWNPFSRFCFTLPTNQPTKISSLVDVIIQQKINHLYSKMYIRGKTFNTHICVSKKWILEQLTYTCTLTVELLFKLYWIELL